MNAQYVLTGVIILGIIFFGSQAARAYGTPAGRVRPPTPT